MYSQQIWICVDRFGKSSFPTEQTLNDTGLTADDKLKMEGRLPKFEIVARGQWIVFASPIICCAVSSQMVMFFNNMACKSFLDSITRRINFYQTSDQAFVFDVTVLDDVLGLIFLEIEQNVKDAESTAYNTLDVLSRSVSVKKLNRLQSLKSRESKVMSQVNQMLECLEQAPFKSEEGAWDSSKTTSVGEIFRMYALKIADLQSCLQNLEDNIAETEDFINIKLNSQSNQLAALNMLMNTGQFAMGIIAAVSGIMGMNLDNTTWGPSIHQGFAIFTVIGLIMAMTAFIVILVYCHRARLLQ